MAQGSLICLGTGIMLGAHLTRLAATISLLPMWSLC